MLKFKQFLTESDGDWYYHGTDPISAAKIAKEGLKPSSLDSKVYLTKVHREAQKYGKIRSGGKIPVVFKIHSSHLNPNHILSNDSGIVQYSGHIKADKLKVE